MVTRMKNTPNQWFDLFVVFLTIALAIIQLSLLFTQSGSSLANGIILFVLALCVIYLFVKQPFENKSENVIYLEPSSPKTISTDEITPEQVFKFNAKAHGFAYKHLHITGVVGEDGSVEVRRRIHMQTHTQISKLDTFLASPEQDVEGAMRILTVDTYGDPRYKVNIKYLPENNDRKAQSIINFVPAISANEEIEFGFSERTPPNIFAIGLTEQEVNERSDDIDYLGWNCDRPIQRLTLEVYFPPSVRFDKNTAFYRQKVDRALPSGLPSGVSHEHEARTLSPKLELVGTQWKLSMSVDYPILGFIYAVGWKPITVDSQVAELTL